MKPYPTKTSITTMKAVLYARVSTEDQRERQSITTQLDFAKRYCELHSITLLDTYLDDGISGTIPVERRAGGAAMLADCRAGKFDTILVYKLDRLARSALELLRCIETLEANKASVKSMTEPFETTSAVGKFMVTMLAGFAQLERDNLRDRSGAGMERAAREGIVIGLPPLGYRVENKRFVIDEEQAVIVRDIFDRYTRGERTVGIAEALQANGVPTRSVFHPRRDRPHGVGKWHNTDIGVILKNTTYKGEYRWRKRRSRKHEGSIVGWDKTPVEEQFVAHVPAIVSAEQFDNVQLILRENFNQAKRNSKRTYLLSGLITCGICGRKFVGHGSRGSGRRKDQFYYHCFSMINHKVGTCGNRGVRVDQIEERVWSDIEGFARDPLPVIEELVTNLRERDQEQLSLAEEQARVHSTSTVKSEERERIITLYRRGRISEEETDRELSRLELELTSLSGERDRLFARQLRAQEIQNNLVNVDSLLVRLASEVKVAEEARRVEIVRALVSEITVNARNEGGRRVAHLDIVYNFNAPRKGSKFINCSPLG